MKKMEQIFVSGKDNMQYLADYLLHNHIKKILLVCGKSALKQNVYLYLEKLSFSGTVGIIPFSDFSPNPTYESVEKGVEIFRENCCDAVMAIGGGSAMDVAKCIKLYAEMPHETCYLHQEIAANQIPLIVAPTTAGTGSESTRFAVIYYRGEKQSVSHESLVPGVVIFDGSALAGLPDYHKKASMLDALCHAIESVWSVHAIPESKEYACKAIKMILQYQKSYFCNDTTVNDQMLMAANQAGKAINITQTTAGHAMSYKLTGIYGIAHGHAAALCVRSIWKLMLQKAENNKEEFPFFQEIADAMGCLNSTEAWRKFCAIIDEMQLEKLSAPSEDELKILCRSVNQDRLKNHPISLSEDEIYQIYSDIFEEETRE